jgi:hypothetical protein
MLVVGALRRPIVPLITAGLNLVPNLVFAQHVSGASTRGRTGRRSPPLCGAATTYLLDPRVRPAA